MIYNPDRRTNMIARNTAKTVLNIGLTLFVTFVLLTSCSKDKIVGTWITDHSDSYSSETIDMKMGFITTVVFESNGEYSNKTESQMGINGNGGSFINMVSVGTWEMQDKEKIIINVKKQSINGIESEIDNVMEWSIITINDNELEVMSKGEKMTFKKKE